MPEPKPEGIFSIQPDLPDISNLQAKLNRPEEVELGILNGKKEMESTFGPLSPKEQDRLQELEQKKNESNLGLGYFTV